MTPASLDLQPSAPMIPQPAEDATRREFLTEAGAVALAAAFLAACGGDDDAEPSPTPATLTPTSTPTPPAPSSLKVFDYGDSVFDLAWMGIAPRSNIYGPDFITPLLDLQEDLDPAVRDAIISGPLLDFREPDIEFLLAEEPDLILSTPNFVRLTGDAWANIEQVAPVVLIPDEASWQERTRMIAAAVDLEELVEQRIASIEARLAALEGRANGRSLGVLRPVPDGRLFAFVEASLSLDMAKTTGFSLADGNRAEQGADSPFPTYAAQVEVSPERLIEFDADWLVIARPLLSLPGLEQLPPEAPTNLLQSVAGGQVFDVPYFLWALNSAAGAEQIVSDLEQLVAMAAAQAA